MTSSVTPPADWYPDPYGGGYLRWWNGIDWSDHTKPLEGGAGAAPPAPPSITPPPYGVPAEPVAFAYEPPQATGYADPYGAPAAGSLQRPPLDPYRAPSMQAAAYATGYPAGAYGAWNAAAADRPVVNGLGTAIRVVFNKFAVFSGRASRSEYWFWALFVFLTGLVIIVPYLGAVLWSLWWMVILLPTLAVTVRRLRDAGLGWGWIFLYLVPLGGIAVFIMTLMPSKYP